jgi:hypothetical protein
MSSVLLLLYRQSLKEAKKIPNENVKQFAIRRIKEEYRNKENPKNNSIKEAQDCIDVLKRYSLISKLYWSNYYTNVLKNEYTL